MADKMQDWMIVLNIIVFTACFKNMFDFKVAKMVWRSFLAIVFYWVFFITLALVAAGVGVVVLYMTNPEYLG